MLLRWIVGRDRVKSLPRKSRNQLKLQQLESREVPSATDLGAAMGYNAFVFGNYVGYNTDAQGALAVGNNATLTNYGVAQNGPDYTGSNSLVVGNDLNYTNGEVFSGNAVYGNNAALTNVTFANGSAQQQSNVVDFASAQTDLDTKATTWGTTYATNGTISSNWGNLVLTGTNSQINIFNLTSSQLQNIYSISIDAPTGSTVLINVSGTEVDLQNLGISIQGTDQSEVLWNFYQATTVNLSGVGVQGSVLAPEAQVNFNNGSLYGTLVADNLTGNGQLDYVQVAIDVPVSVPADVSGIVFNDLNQNGVQDPGEQGLDGVAVYLAGTQTAGGTYNTSTTTAGDGTFGFDNVPPGNYIISASTIDNTWFTVSVHVGSQGGIASVPNSDISNVALLNASNGVLNNFGQIQNTSGNGTD